MILNPSHFEGELAIGQVGQFLEDDFAFSEAINVFVKKYEPIFYRATMGETLYRQILDGIEPSSAPEPEQQKWLALAERTAPYAAMFVWFYYMQNSVSQTSGVDGLNSSTPKPSKLKMARVWNEIVDNIVGMTQWVCDREDEYPGFAPDMDLFLHYELCRHKNHLGI